MATTNGSTAIRDKILASLARYRALRIGKFPCAFWRLSARPGLTAWVISVYEVIKTEIFRKIFSVSGSRYFCESLFWASQPKQAAKT
ncbi:hypothetical protein [Bathymodiolus japonicus methanotrophic gill symbiont]|uniref:hypothetical protein n=1 Tax=Bathymodiolus japonicus methanotrophic gill symbiont TaxID=113269 RepID=UPI001C8D81C9|nr:hypothetical protein [Bathymodiolus japonicus methanotrophic gill symbiont]